MKKSAFFDFLNRTPARDFQSLLSNGEEETDYIDWNGYLLPRHYGDEAMEYQSIRNRCALFDVSPIRKFRIQGSAAGRFFDHLCTRPLSSAECMRGIYVVFCNEDGTLKDDAIAYKLAEDDYLLMPSDIDHSEHFEMLRARLGISSAALSITECTENWVGTALQGPMSTSVLHAMGFAGVETLKPFEVRRVDFVGSEMLLGRMGFTADLGYECWMAPAQGPAFERAIGTARTDTGLPIPGYGLGALESCRLEGGFVVAGWDFATEADPAPGFERNPYEVGLGWLVNLDGPEFYGRRALQKQRENGHRHLLRTFQADSSASLEEGMQLIATIDDDDRVIGSVNCFAWSGMLDRYVGNVSIDSAFSEVTTAHLAQAGESPQVTLGRGAHINLDRRNEVPAALLL